MGDVPAPRKPLFVPLARSPYEAFAYSLKTVEVRQDAPRWSDRHVYPGRLVRLRLGYSGRQELLRVITDVARAPHFDALPMWAKKGAHIGDPENSPFFQSDTALVAFMCLHMNAANQHLWDVKHHDAN